ncbi:tetratricopeptide repeat-containing sulfotransferase family protein [Brevundimonas sp.]|uniref:tetratricopeptide repeat-containing sulfotransferase family protein n=1 Tax=Brevundimonas sp. TaxID=1871086 RepID=UPI002B94594D|nr:sulfotransferase [Brevundimonas sp.]HWQ86998.1 sulfotransferase [Brevundimonas sp.]
MASLAVEDDAMAALGGVSPLIRDGRIGEALSRLATIEAGAGDDARLLQHLGEHYTHCGKPDAAARCYRRAVALTPDDPGCLYNLSAALIALGQIVEAEALLDRVIALAPHDADAWQNRSTLRRQTPDANHVAGLLDVVEQVRPGPAEVALCYALAKELEDLGDTDHSFAWLKRGADRRRGRLSYRVEADVAAMAEIARVFDAALFERPASGCLETGPVFVLGLPRSGTTLVDRIISSHGDVDSLGEINDFALALTRLAGATGGKGDLIRRSADLDPAALGRAYLDSVAGYGRTRPMFIDKTPVNFLYIGLIARALPNARIIHLRRHPLDSGYALYKTLFRMGCPYSYDLEDLAAYMLAHRRLMDHWRTVVPGRILDVDYEALIADQEAVSRRIVDHCGLDWQDACLTFHENTAPAATASAAQVRQPIHARSVGLWRRYADQLEPLAAALRAGGVDPMELV